MKRILGVFVTKELVMPVSILRALKISRLAVCGSALFLSYGLTGCGTSTCQDLQTSVLGVSTEDWMAQVYSSQDISLRDIIIPGTHNSGTYDVTESSQLSSGSDSILHLFAKEVVVGWSKTQACDISQQLSGGIRYLDLRLEWYDGQVWISHGMLSDTLENVLDDVNSFSESHPQEIIILDFQQLTSSNHHTATHELIQETIGDQVLGPQWGASATLHQLWEADEGNIVVLMNGASMAALSDYYWLRDTILESNWPNSSDAGMVYASVTNSISIRDESKLNVAQAIVTVDASSFIDGLLGGRSTLFKFNQNIADNVSHWVSGWVDDGLPVNIVITDFYDHTGVVQTIIEANINALSQTLHEHKDYSRHARRF